jgi:hypothetical protein
MFLGAAYAVWDFRHLCARTCVRDTRRNVVLIAYCTGLICVCTVLLVVSTVLTVKNYWLLRDLTAASPPGRHEAAAAAARREPKRREVSPPREVRDVREVREVIEPRPPRDPRPKRDRPERHSERFDSALPPSDSIEWTGPVTPYTPESRTR